MAGTKKKQTRRLAPKGIRAFPTIHDFARRQIARQTSGQSSCSRYRHTHDPIRGDQMGPESHCCAPRSTVGSDQECGMFVPIICERVHLHCDGGSINFKGTLAAPMSGQSNGVHAWSLMGIPPIRETSLCQSTMLCLKSTDYDPQFGLESAIGQPIHIEISEAFPPIRRTHNA